MSTLPELMRVTDAIEFAGIDARKFRADILPLVEGAMTCGTRSGIGSERLAARRKIGSSCWAIDRSRSHSVTPSQVSSACWGS